MNEYEALRIAVKAHAGQLDKCGIDYILHPIAVADAVSTHGRNEHVGHEGLMVVALLHDVLEDTDYPLPRIDFAPWQYYGLLAITRLPGESYFPYIARLSRDPYARIVKLADLWHNLQPERMAYLPVSQHKSLERRYLKARDRIWEALGYEWWPQGEGKS